MSAPREREKGREPRKVDSVHSGLAVKSTVNACIWFCVVFMGGALVLGGGVCETLASTLQTLGALGTDILSIDVLACSARQYAH